MKIKLIILGALCFYTGLFGMESVEPGELKKKDPSIVVLEQLKDDVPSQAIKPEDISKDLYLAYCNLYSSRPRAYRDNETNLFQLFTKYAISTEGLFTLVENFENLKKENISNKDARAQLLPHFELYIQQAKEREVEFINVLNQAIKKSTWNKAQKTIIDNLTIEEFIIKNYSTQEAIKKLDNWDFKESVKNTMELLLERLQKKFNINDSAPFNEALKLRKNTIITEFLKLYPGLFTSQ